MNWKEFKYLVNSDLYRCHGNSGTYNFFHDFIWNPGFQYAFYLRLCAYLRKKVIYRCSLYFFAKGILRHYSFKYGISIPSSIPLGSGLYIGYTFGIVVNDACVIGKNCNLSQGVTLGQANRGPRKGAPVVGDNVYIGPGAKLVGKIRIGNNVAIGANCVVTKDIPDNAVVVGVPGKIISYNGSYDYINRTDY